MATTFRISSDFDVSQAEYIQNLLTNLYGGSNIQSSLDGLDGKTIYIQKYVPKPNEPDTAFFQFTEVNPASNRFYVPDATGHFTTENTETASFPYIGPTVQLSVGKVIFAMAGLPSTTVGTPVGESQNSLTRTIFHELYHANIFYTAGDIYRSDDTNYKPNEAVAIAAENLIFAKAFPDQANRVGHLGNSYLAAGGSPFTAPSIDSSLPFSHVETISGSERIVDQSYYYQFSGIATDGGTIGKSYYTPDNYSNYVIVSGTRDVLVSSDGTQSQTFKDALSGILSPTNSVTNSIDTISYDLNSLKAISTKALGENSSSLSSILSQFSIDDFHNVIGLSNERWTDGKPTVNLVGPAGNTSPNQQVSYLDLKATAASIVIGASGYRLNSFSFRGLNSNGGSLDRLQGSNEGHNILIAGNGATPGAVNVAGPSVDHNILLAGSAGDILIGGKGADRLMGNEGGDIFITSGGKDEIIGGGGSDIVILGDSASRVDAAGSKAVITTGSDKTNVSGVNIFVGGSLKAEFYGSGHSIFIGGSGGAEFHLKSGDVAIGSADAKQGNVFYVTTEDMVGGHIGIVGFGKKDKLYVDGKLFDGSSAYATSLGMSYDSNNDGTGNAGIFNKFSSNWGTNVTQPNLYDTYDEPADHLRRHYWINGDDLYSGGPINVRAVTYIKSADNGSGPSGDIYFSDQSASGQYGDETTVKASLNISITGWQQGYGGIKFFENNLARDTLGALSIGGGISGWSGPILGGGPASPAFRAGTYMLDGQLTKVGGLFDPTSSEWLARSAGETTAWDKINQMIDANRVGSTSADLADDNPYGVPFGGFPGGGGFPGFPGGGPLGETDLDGDGPPGSSSILLGDSSANILDSKGVYTGVSGAGGGDTIIFEKGYGLLSVDEQDNGQSPSNTLQLGVGLTAADANITGNSGGDIVISFAGYDKIVLKGALNSADGITRGVQQVSFADGTIWNYNDLLAAVGTAHIAGQAIFGDKTANFLDSEGLASTVVGGGGGDTIAYEAGYGKLTIDEQSYGGSIPNTLAFGTSVDPWSMQVSGRSDGSIVLDLGYGDTISISKALLSTPDLTYGIQSFTFSDGTTWSYQDILQMADYPSDSNQTLYGDRSANFLSGGGVATSLVGNGGGDTFFFSRGDRPITIVEADTVATPNALILSGFNSGDIRARADQLGNIELLADGNVQVIIANALNGTDQQSTGVQSISFDDGTVWSYADLLSKSQIASADNVSLYGDSGSSTFDPAGFATNLVGGGGGDTFVYARGYGAVAINEVETNESASNVLAFGADIMAGDVSVQGTDGGDLVLSLGNGDQVTLVGALLGEASVRYGVQSVTFGDGTSWTYNDLMLKANTPTIEKTAIFGGSGADLLDTAGTVHTAVGNGGGDSFVYNVGYGAVTIVEHDYSLDQTNTINLGVGILPADVTVSGTSDGSIVIALGQGDSITIQNALQSNEVENFGVQKVAFADGTNWTYQTLLSKVGTAAAGTGTIFGDRSSNVLDTAGLAHEVVGGGGDDKIIFNRGYGEVHVVENDDDALSKNLLVFGQGINISDVSIEGGLSGDITLNTGQGDTVVLKGALKSTDNHSYGVQLVSFNDGTVWTYADLIAKLGTPSTPNGTIYGDASSNYLDGNGLATTAVGGGGGDTFVFNPGYGHLTISEQESSPNRVNILKLGAGIDTTNVAVTADAAGNVTLSHRLNDQVELMSALNGDGNYSYGVQSIQFADGTAWSYGDLVKRSQVSSTLNTVLYGTNLSDDFDSAGFASSIIGNGGGDTFHYGYGHGSLSITEHDDAALPANVLVFEAGINPSNVSVSATPAGDISLTLDSGETVTLIGAASFAGGTATGVQQVLFDGGLSWSTADIRALAQGHWDISDDGQQHTINEALVPQAAPPTIIVGFASTSATATLGSDRNAVTVTSSNGTAVVISDLMRKGIRTSQVIQYSDGVVQTLGDLIEGSSNTQGIINYAVGTQSAEDIYIDDGIKQVLGFGGGDTIHYNLGGGRVTVDEQDVHSHPDNILTFGAGILLSDITVKSDGANLYLSISDTDQVVISNALNSDFDTSYGVQQVRFADGTSQSYEQLLAIADTGSANNDGTLYGDAEGNVIDPNGYSHYVMSGGGNDTIIYRKGYGDISIQDYSQSPGKVATIAFGPDILPSDVDISPNTDRYSASGAMNIGVDGSTIRIDYEMIGDDPVIGALSFSDGTVLTYADMLAKMATPVAGKFAIGGDFGANTLDTQGLVYTAVGNGGGDTFIYNRTYGALTIKEYDNSPSPANRLLFGSTITPEDVAVSLSYNGLYKLDLGNGDSVTFDAGQFSSKDGVQSVEFADGTAWDEDRLLLEANSGHPGKVSIEGTYLNETFDSRGYSRIISGRAGDDTYVFNSGYGALTVIDGSYYNQNTDTVAFGSGITATDLVASRYGDNLILSLGSSDRLVLYNQFVPSNGYKQGVTEFTFADGSSFSASYFTEKANAPLSGMAPIIGSGSELHTSLTLPSSSSTMTSNGYVDFEDADAGHIHSANVVSVDYDTSSYAVLPYREEMLNYLSTGITTEPSVNGDGKVSWIFSAPSSAFDALAPGETVDVKFTVEIKDQNNSLVHQDVVVSVASPITGTQSTPQISGTSGDDTLNLDTNFIVNPGAGNDSLYTSYYGGGSIQFASGDGHDTLFDYASYITRTDNLLLTDVESSGVTISRDGDSLTIYLDATGDSFTAANQFTGTTVGLQNIQFANGVIWDRDEINARANATTPTPVDPDNVGGSPDEGHDMNSSTALRRNDVDMTDFRSGYIKVAFDPFSQWAHVLDDSRAMGDIAGSITGSDSASPAFHSTKLANLYASNHVRDF